MVCVQAKQACQANKLSSGDLGAGEDHDNTAEPQQ